MVAVPKNPTTVIFDFKNYNSDSCNYNCIYLRIISLPAFNIQIMEYSNCRNP